MAAPGGPHLLCVIRGTNLFATRLAGRACIGSQIAINLPPDAEPEPDIPIVRTVADDVDSYLPTADGIHLLIEVAHTTSTYDPGTKLGLYARHQIEDAWIVNLNSRGIEVYREPQGRAYTSLTMIGRADSLLLWPSPRLLLPAQICWAGHSCRRAMLRSTNIERDNHTLAALGG